MNERNHSPSYNQTNHSLKMKEHVGRILKKSDIYSFNVLNGNNERQIGFEKF